MAGDKLTGELIMRRVFDPVTQALKMAPAAATETEIEISADDGDSVITYPNNAVIEAINDEISCVGMRSAQLYIAAGAASQAKLQVSPVDTGDVWVDLTGSTLANDPADLKAGTIQTICSRRIRAVVVSGTPTVYVVIQAV